MADNDAKRKVRLEKSFSCFCYPSSDLKYHLHLAQLLQLVPRSHNNNHENRSDL